MSLLFPNLFYFFHPPRNYMPSKKLVQNTLAGTLPPNMVPQAQMTSPQNPNLNPQSNVPATIQSKFAYVLWSASIVTIFLILETNSNILIGLFASLPSVIQAPPQFVEPMFIVCPPRPQRVLHSEAYLKYIEGYRQDTRFITPWEKTIKAREETVPPVEATKLPLNWIGYKDQTKPEEVASALWQLRDYMMKDVLTIPRHEY